jgi:signal peptidase I
MNERAIGAALRGISFVLAPFALSSVVYLVALPDLPLVDDASPHAQVTRWAHRQPLMTVALLSWGFSMWMVSLRHRLPFARWLVRGAPAQRGLDVEGLQEFEARHEAKGKAPRIGGVLLVLLAAGLALSLRSYVIGVFVVPSSSMEPTIREGDYLLTRRWPFAVRREVPARGEVIVVEHAVDEGLQHLVKRVIGLPGDRVSMRGGHPVVNGELLPFCDVGAHRVFDGERMAHARLFVERAGEHDYLAAYTPLYREFEGEVLVGEGDVFLLGDNRNNSQDSRSLHRGRGAGFSLASVVGRVALLGAWGPVASLWPRSIDPLHLDGLDDTLARAARRCLTQLRDEERKKVSTNQSHSPR